MGTWHSSGAFKIEYAPKDGGSTQIRFPGPRALRKARPGEVGVLVWSGNGYTALYAEGDVDGVAAQLGAKVPDTAG